jgi:rhodanese-related sulfurtransferase
VAGAVSLTVADFDNQLGAFLDVWEPGRRVVVYCDSADCGASHEVAARLRDEAGIQEVYVLTGGARDLRF